MMKVFPLHESVEVVGEDAKGRRTIVGLERWHCHLHPDDDGRWGEWQLDRQHSQNLPEPQNLKEYIGMVDKALALVEKEPDAEAGLAQECASLEAMATRLVSDMTRLTHWGIAPTAWIIQKIEALALKALQEARDGR